MRHLLPSYVKYCKEQGTTEDKDIEIVMRWIQTAFIHTVKFYNNKYNSHALNNMMREDGNIFVHNEVFKQAMYACGFTPSTYIAVAPLYKVSKTDIEDIQQSIFWVRKK